MRASTTKTWLGLLAGVQTLMLLSMWAAGPSPRRAEAAGIPDAGAQRDELINQLKAANDKLDRLITLLAGGKLEVTVKKAADADRNR